ncbi:hypothetical protein MGA5115_02363 [Marinomonas gallaica]|uniref:Uncharacterized protein n=1 Tax=Marinomonas gallaica TaxID=1806667 RepID=A0A1C3JSW5_9GAMM|nr:hypothetical protein [Marinomonas gallaica]SBT18242.1 hypothetical protein MGA5115_02363 [Marinomonas gallaica]SBT22622.1 hypothetical protein MGA5116_03245 [Marinomonas gallaica]
MAQVTVYYQHREGGTELVNHEEALYFHRDACEVIDHYPWVEEQALFEELGEGGGFFFLLGDIDSLYATFQLLPIEKDGGVLYLDIVLKPGFLGIFGRKSVSVDYDFVSIADAKHHIKAFFEDSIESLYVKHKK